MVLNPEAFIVSTVVPQIEFTDPLDLNVSIINAAWSEQAAVVDLLVQLGEDVWVVQGTSKRLSGDQPNPQIGIGLALGRALEKVTNQVLRQANGLVKHNDDNRQKRREVAKAKLQTAAKKKAKKVKA